MIISLMMLFSNSTLVAGALRANAEKVAAGFVTANMRGGPGLAGDRLRIGRAAEEWPYAL